MNIKILTLFNIFIILLLIQDSSCNKLKVYPDHYVSTDSPYSYSSLYLSSDIKGRQIYKLGYFSSTKTSDIISSKHGLRYKPDNFCTDIDGNDKTTTGKRWDIFSIIDETTTRVENFSEELELLENYCFSTRLKINTPFPTLHNTGYILRYKLIISNDAGTDPSIDINLRIIKKDNSFSDNFLCKFSMKAGKPDWFRMTIKSKLSITNRINMIFICDLTEDTKSFDVNTDDKYQFIIGNEGETYNIYLSFYQIILEDSTDSYLSNLNDNKIIRTFNGLEKCGIMEGGQVLEESKCLYGYVCESKQECLSCPFRCNECESVSACKNCGVLTDIEKYTSSCEINYIDLTNFNNFEFNVTLKQNEFHERSSFGFWIFISDLSKARNGNANIYHVALKDRYVLSIIPNELSVGVYLHAYEDLYRKITTEAILEGNYADRSSDYVLTRTIPTTEQLKYINSKDLSGQWFHVSCGLSFDHKKFYLSTMINGEASSIERALRHENLYYDSAKNQYVENDIYNRHIITDKQLQVLFRNFADAGSKIFLRYFLLFEEYIPPSYKYMYYNYFDNDPTNFNYQIIAQVNFDKLIINDDEYFIQGRNYSTTISQMKLNKIINREVDLTAPQNFKYLFLPKTNEVYNTINCDYNSKSSISGSSLSKINWDIDDDGKEKPLFCNGYLNTQDDECIAEGSTKCRIGDYDYIIYPGPKIQSENSGYCDYLCSGPMRCENDYLQAPKSSPFSDNFCNLDGREDLYNLYYSCESTDTYYYLQFSSFYNSRDFSIGFAPLHSYIFEIWYYPDFFLSDNNRQGKYYFPETQKNYILYTNLFQAYFLHSEYKTLKVEDDYSTHTTPHYHPYEWNKLVFYGLFKNSRHYKYFIINNMINDQIEFKHIHEDLSLSWVYFRSFGNKATTTDHINQWASGYYRGLRIWDGDKASIPLTILYDNYYTNGVGRISSIIGYYPLTNRYIGDNILTEITGQTRTEVQSGESRLRRYNFSSKFDFIRSQYPSLGYYLLADATAPKASQCGTGCLRCWNAGSNCYECAQGYILNLQRACVRLSKYYFKSPCIDQNAECKAYLTVPDEIIDYQKAISVCFWIKPIGFSSSTPHRIIEFSDELYLEFEETYGSPRFGLSLIKTEASGDGTDTILVSNEPNFREKIGYWTFISIAYYKRQIRTTNSKSYFPQMVNFEVNEETLPIIKEPSPSLPFKFNRLNIPIQLYGLIFNIRFYLEYIIGAYGFATNNGNLISPFAIPQPIKSYLVPGTTSSNCLDTRDFTLLNGGNFGCAGDNDNLFDSFATSYNNYIYVKNGYGQPKECEFKNDYDNSESNCLNACKGVSRISCTCMNRNYNSQMLIKRDDNNLIYCRTLDYINFSKSKPIKIEHIRTAKETKKFTLQFWIYFLNNDEGNFKEASFKWEGHANITVYRKDEKNYFTNCKIFYIEDKIEKIQESGEAPLKSGKWNFISCSADYENRYFYFNLNNDIDMDTRETLSNNQLCTDELDGPRLCTYFINPSVPSYFMQEKDWSTLSISDNTELDDWGYLYFRQIHIWKFAYFNAEFLSRVEILTPSKFPYLLHSWDTHFRGYKDGNFNKNFILKDIAEIAHDFNVSKIQPEPLGFNYIPEKKILYIDLCSEDGEYYDFYLKKCLPFADLGLIDDITFTNVPFSYSGSYSMGFWIFFEDASTISSGIHLKWERHLQVTVIKTTTLKGYCLPQGYYSDDISNSQFTEKLGKVKYYVEGDILAHMQSDSGVWIWVLCSVSNYAESYFIKGNGAKYTATMNREDLYYSDITDEGQPVKNAYPYHYYMSEVEDGKPQSSKLHLEGLSNDKRIYIRDLFLFKDYIPDWYAEAFKNTDLTQLDEDKMLQSMVFACNFADFNLDKMTLTYYVINESGSSQTSTFTKTKKTLKLYRASSTSYKTFELCSNFAFIKISNPVSGSLCKLSTNDTKPDTIFWYCNDNRTPIVCRNLHYITTLDEINPSCEDQCYKINDEQMIRVPGAPSHAGICGIAPANKIQLNTPTAMAFTDYYGQNTLKCEGNYNQIGYKCYDKTKDEKSGFFFSRCYNQPNFYGVISNESKEKMPNGYFFEFWFKLDKVQILQHCDTTATEEYILHATPHSIYLDLNENKYYYKILDSVYSSALDGISDYEWNKIVIKTTLGVTLGQNVYVYINFDIDNIKATILNIASSVKMQLQYISFCSGHDNGDCTPAGAADVTWGSAYYRNIRIWELFSSSIYTIQDFNVGIYTEKPNSLKLFYPLLISEMNYNKLNQVIGNKIDSIKVVHEESDDFNSLDAYGFYNYATNFDWGVEDTRNKDRFISSMDGIYITSQDCGAYCERCYSKANTNCYKCKEGYVLKKMTCVTTDKTFLKIPIPSGTRIEFEITNVDGGAEFGRVTTYPGITIHFYMKFEGVLPDITTSAPHIIELRPNTYIAYNTLTANLEFDIEGENAFKYTTFYEILGVWIPYSIAIYVGQDPIPTRYPHMFTFSVNKEDIPFVNGYSLPSTLNRINYIYLGREVIALFADLRIYNHFIQGSFGHAISVEKDNNRILHYTLVGSGNGGTNCLPSTQTTNSAVATCVTDYTDYLAKSCGSDITKYFDLSIPGEEPCASCSDYCKTKCFNSEKTECTCDMTNGLYWLRRNKRTRVTYCEYLPSVDYSILKDSSFAVPVSKNFESTIEFWIFIYSYNPEVSQFTSVSLEWHLHNRIKIENKGSSIMANCYAFFDKNDEGKYTEYISLAITGYTWLYMRCGTDYISFTKKFFLNSAEEELLVTSENYPDRDSVEVTTFEIKTTTPASYGFLFLREIKLWQQYNFKYINTQYINLVDDVGLYDVSIHKSTGIYPGLITYITSEFNQEDYEEVMNYNYKYKLINLVGKDDLGYVYRKTYTLYRNEDEFLGYNIVDPDNYGYYEDFLICEEGYYYNSESNVCLEVTLTKCRYPGDVSDNCISCPDETPYIYPPTGDCVLDCGPRFYPRDDMFQCRDCHWTCYTCWSYAINNCLSCIDDRYLVESLHMCVLYCENYGLVASKITPNLCVDFEALPRLVNYQEGVPIDINTFDYLIAEILEINSKNYLTRWSFDPVKTRNANPGRTLKFEDDEVPFEPNTEDNLGSLNVTLNHSFFELKTDYVFTLEVISYNILNTTKRVSRFFDFVLTMNSYPVDGNIKVIPEVGLHNTTVFLIRCKEWTDDTCPSINLTYYFYAIEDLSDEVIVLQDWSTNNEIISSFALEKDALPSNDITVYCKIRDNYLAETEVSQKITLVTDLSIGLYNLEDAVNDFEYVYGEKFPENLTPIEFFDISEVLKSLGIDVFKPLRPSFYQTIYKPSIDKEMVVKTEPECVTFDKECNYRGTCTINVDIFLVCRCDDGYTGKNCHIDKNGGSALLEKYNEFYTLLFNEMKSPLDYYHFRAMHNLFDGAQYFCEDPTFFSSKLKMFISRAIDGFQASIDNNTYEYIDLLEYYYSYELYRLNDKRVTKMYNTGLYYRDLPINNEDKQEFANAFDYIYDTLREIINYKCKMHLNTQISYSYSSTNFYIAIKSVNPTFDENEFFEERKEDYRSFPRFMSCLNYIENNRLDNPYFQTFMIYTEYLNFPYGYDEKIYDNNTSPLIDLRFMDATNGKDFDLTGCTGPYYINIDMPFTSYKWLDQINKQKSLYDPRNYKAPDDPIFSDPIYINKSGYVSDDTVEQRIKKYHRKYNISCKYYDKEEYAFLESGVIFTNFTSDTNFIEFNTSHLTKFTSFFVLNNATFKVKGRFFYVPRTELMKWKGNYTHNFGLFVFIAMICVYAVFSLVLGCYDSIYFVQETLLESLKKEIVKAFLPYKNRKEKEKDAEKIIPVGLDPNLINMEKLGDKVKENNRYGNKNDENEDNKNLDEPKEKDFGLNINNKTIIGSSERLMGGARVIKDKSKEFLNMRKKGDKVLNDHALTGGNRFDQNVDLELQNFLRTYVGQKELSELNPNRLPEVFENKDIEYQRRLNGYANLGLTFCEFLGKNILQRNILISPFFNISMFAPRWKKLVVFTTELAIEMLLLAVFLTNDANATDQNLTLLLQYSAYTTLITDVFMHFFTIFFQVSSRQKRRLLKLVLMRGQLIVLKEYEDMQCVNTFITVIGMLISFAIWSFAFYMSFTFYSVWKVQNLAFIYTFGITVSIDFVILEFIYELFLAIIYMQRKTSALLRRVGEFLNRLRNHRCMF